MPTKRRVTLKNVLSIKADPSGRKTKESKKCHIPSCGQTTRRDKEYCLLHIAHNPYARYVLKEIEKREHEDDKVALRGSHAANLNGITAKEILLELRQHGSRTTKRLSRDLQIEQKVIHSYVIALRKSKRVSVSASKRGCTVVTARNPVKSEIPSRPDVERVL